MGEAKLARIRTSTVHGIDAIPVDVEVQVRQVQSDREQFFSIIGLADNAVRESRDRVLSALKISGFRYPNWVLVNLAPAEIKKEGASFDLAIATGILAASGQLPGAALHGLTVHGELSLSGQVRPIRGALPLAIEALRHKLEVIVVPQENLAEASILKGIRTVGVNSLAEFAGWLNGTAEIPEREASSVHAGRTPLPVARRVCDVLGQENAKRAMLVAAAGGHNILMIGPPGCGKSMLAERFPSIMPRLTQEEMLEVVKIHSVAGLPVAGLLSGQRPYRNPHYVISDAGLLGGGSMPRPGEISLAHRGVLFLDEFPEYRRSGIEGLRCPLETGQIRVARAKASLIFPARFQLVAAMNPCPCGKLGVKGAQCLCSRPSVQKYLSRVSLPILDRIDLHVALEAVPFTVMSAGQSADCGEREARMREEVLMARQRQLLRQDCLNSELGSEAVSKSGRISPSAMLLLETAARKLSLSARGYFRVLKLSLTIADLSGSEQISEAHLAEAISYRGFETLRKYCMDN